MKKLLFFTAVIFATVSVQAQKTVTTPRGTKFEIAANVGSSTAAEYKMAYGADIEADFPVSTHANITGSLGYEHFHWEVAGNSFSGNTNQIPILAGLKYFLSTYFYAHGQIGYSLKGNTSSTQSNQLGFTNDNSLAYALSLGYNPGSWDIGVKYLATRPGGSDLGGVVLRVAYSLGHK